MDIEKIIWDEINFNLEKAKNAITSNTENLHKYNIEFINDFLDIRKFHFIEILLCINGNSTYSLNRSVEFFIDKRNEIISEIDKPDFRGFNYDLLCITAGINELESLFICKYKLKLIINEIISMLYKEIEKLKSFNEHKSIYKLKCNVENIGRSDIIRIFKKLLKNKFISQDKDIEQWVEDSLYFGHGNKELINNQNYKIEWLSSVIDFSEFIYRLSQNNFFEDIDINNDKSHIYNWVKNFWIFSDKNLDSIRNYLKMREKHFDNINNNMKRFIIEISPKIDIKINVKPKNKRRN